MTKRRKEIFVTLSDVESKKVRWLLKPLIPYGMITIMEGDPGIGKSYLAMHIAAQVSIGGSLPGAPKIARGWVLYISAEDDAAYTIRPRIDAMGGDPSRIRVQAEYEALDDDGIEKLLKEVLDNPPRLIVLDPLFAYVPGAADMYRPNVIRALLSQLKEVAELNNTAFLVIRHLTKTKRDKAIYQGMGSMDVIGAARSAFLVAPHPDEPNWKVVAHVKYNLSERGQSWMYELVPGKGDGLPTLRWIGPTDLMAEDLMGSDDGHRQTAMDDAIDFLRMHLRDGPQSAKEMEAKALAAGIAKRTLDRAREEIKVQSKKKRGGWYWSLPDDR